MSETMSEMCPESEFLPEAVPEVTMLVITCEDGDEVLLILDPHNIQRGWTFVSTTVQSGEEPIQAIHRTVRDKLDLDISNRVVRFIKRKAKKSTSFSSFTIELPRDEFEYLRGTGPRGHSVRAIPIHKLRDYLDRGRYDMGVSPKTRIPSW